MKLSRKVFLSRPQVEILESRIAPSVFFVLGNGTVVNSAGTSVDDASAATLAAGSDTHLTLAVDLHSGDSLVFSPHNTHKAGPGQTQLMKVTSGDVIAFFTDPTSTAGLNLQDFTGIAVSDGFTGTVTANVFGPIGTGVTASGGTLTFAPSATGSIAGLKMTGHIFGNLYAEGSINDVKIMNPAGSPPAQLSVGGDITTGNENSASESFDGGLNYVPISYTFAPGSNGGNISNVVLANGTSYVESGQGIFSAAGAGGNGGSISNLTVMASPYDITVESGTGGLGGNGVGGSGGSITGIIIHETTLIQAGVIIGAGSGAAGATGGGTGGGVSNVLLTTSGRPGTFSVASGNGGGVNGTAGNGGSAGSITGLTGNTGYEAGAITIMGGKGGTPGVMGNGGMGGSINNLSLTTGIVTQGIIVDGGSGGAAVSGTGGQGGALDKISVTTHGTTVNGMTFMGGGGGSPGTAGSGGDGGGVNNFALTTDAFVASGITIESGSGGSGLSSSGLAGNAGSGGAVANLSVVNMAPNSGSLTVESGSGGTTSVAGGQVGAAGNGGMISNVSLNPGVVGAVTVQSGVGGVATAADGGAGGDISKVSITDKDYIASVSVHASNGGGVASLTGTTGNGGAGGSISGVSITVKNLTQGSGVTAGTGGAVGGNTTGNGGDGGGISSASVTILGVQAGFSVKAGTGGNAGFLGNGGAGGNLATTGFTDPLGTVTIDALDSGSGGNGGGTTGDGGDGGTVSKITMSGTNTYYGVEGGNGGTYVAGDTGTGGTGGSVSDVSGSVGILYVEAGNGGGPSNSGTASGTGGAGGSVSSVQIGKVGMFVRAISAGNGGAGSAGEGAGGSINTVKVAGDIGDFLADFNTAAFASNSGMGGLIAGEGGNGVGNGSISDVTAGRIAAIVAGESDGLALDVATNAVSTLSDINAKVIGADIFGNGVVDDTSGNAWSFSDATSLADGIVIVFGDGTFTGNHPAPLGEYGAIPI